ncbi:siphovirus Gp157 family protein, partial [Salmonella enterica]|uniref:siphovirus Gp157 family protein n=1 Tax=Salmonella enterica TaxID=28901 RepID=UPI000C224C08
MATLYKLNESYQNILQVAEMMDEEDFKEALNGIEDDIENKADGYAKVIKELEIQVDGLKREEKRLKERRTILENKIKNMKENLENSMKLQGKTKFKTPLFSFNIQNNAPSLTVMDE